MGKFNAEEEIKSIRGQITDLIKLLGFTGYSKGDWIDSRQPDMYFATTDLIREDRSKQQATRGDLEMLLDYFNLELIREKVISEIIKKESPKEKKEKAN